MAHIKSHWRTASLCISMWHTQSGLLNIYNVINEMFFLISNTSHISLRLLQYDFFCIMSLRTFFLLAGRSLLKPLKSCAIHAMNRHYNYLTQSLQKVRFTISWASWLVGLSGRCSLMLDIFFVLEGFVYVFPMCDESFSVIGSWGTLDSNS